MNHLCPGGKDIRSCICADPSRLLNCFFFFHVAACPVMYTLSLHDALPICPSCCAPAHVRSTTGATWRASRPRPQDRKSTRLNSSHVEISYAVSCLKKKISASNNNLRTETKQTRS